ncbi:MAG TPA: hypothetical protein VGM97_20610 [Steroidobacteraceae bacterium]|jgi:hypothetical protein
MTTTKRTHSLAPYRSIQCIALTCVLSVIALEPRTAAAKSDFVPYGDITVEHNSNVFSAPSTGIAGITSLGDTISEFVAGVNSDFDWGQDSLKVNVEGRHFIYDHYSYLGHSEYTAGGVLDWHLGPVVESELSYTQTHDAANFADTLTTQLELNTSKTGEARFRILVTPEWRLQLIPREHEEDMPLPGFPDFHLRETWGSASIEYLGVSKLTAGLQADYVSGEYRGIPDATRYHQEAAEFTATYKVTDKSDFSGNVGYTQRTSSPNESGSIGSVPGAPGNAGDIGDSATLTGQFGYHLNLTPKTEATLAVFRNIDSYVAGANSEIGTGGSIGLKWSPDFRFTFDLSYRIEHDAIAGDVVLENVTDRSDRLNSARFQVAYTALRWLKLMAFVSHDDRSSNFAAAEYVDTIVGIQFDARFE